MSSRLGKLAGLKPPPAPSDPGAAAAAPATTPGSVASSPFMKPSAPVEPAVSPSPAVTPVSSPVAKPAGGASSFGLAGKKMPMFKSITAAPPPPPETTTPTSSSVNPLASPTPQPGSPAPMAPLASPNNSAYTNGYHSPAPAAPLSPSPQSNPSPVTPLNLNAVPAAAPPMVSPNFSNLGMPPPPPPGGEEIEPMAPPSPKPMQEVSWSAPAGTPGGPAAAPVPAPVTTPAPAPAGGFGAKAGTPSKIAQMLGTSTAPPAPVAAPPPEEPKASKLAMIKNAAKPPPAPAASPSDPSTWNFDDDDNETNIVFSDDDPEKMHIKGATLCKLVQWLTYEKYRESEYLMGFLLTYRSFTTAFDLVEILKLRYVWVPANLKDKDEKSPEMDDFRKNRQLPIRIRILNVFRHWITHLFYDFQGEQGKLLGQKVLEFFDQHVITSMEKMGAPIKIALQKKLANNGEEKEGVFIFSPGTKFPTPIIPVNITTLGFMDINFEEIARQLTLIESDYYKAIKPWECLGQAWTKSDKAVRAPNVLRFIHRFNQVSKWVAAEIVRVENLKTRVSVLGHAIQIANKCLELRNLNACMAVMSGLQSTAVFRLKQTWAGLPKNQTKMFEDIHAIVSSQKSFGRMREMLKTIEAPCIPYLGMYLTDLIFLEDGMPNHLAGTNLINYYKRRKQAEVIMMIQRYQQSPFALEPVSFIQEYLLGVPVPDEEELYNQSLLREEKQTTTGGAAGAPKKDDKKKEPEKPKAPETAPAKPAPAAGKPAALAPVSGVSAKGAATAATTGAVGKPGEADEFGELDMPEGYPFAQPDGPQNITFCKDSSIKAATLTKLVERMTFEKYTDVAILTAFLMTYRDYATPLEILELLIQRYNVPRPRNAAPDVLQRFTTVKEVPIHLRIFNFMKNWIEKYWVDFYEDGDLRETFIEFIDNQFSGSMEKAAETLRRNLQKNLEAGPEGFRDVTVMPQKPPLPYQPPSFLQADPQMTDFHPEELARQLSLQMFEIYGAIRPREFLSYLRCVGDPIKTYEVAPNIVRFLRFTTQLRMWLLSAILRHREPRLRAQVITHAIKMLEKLDEFNNWNCANEIVTALNQDYIRKMAKTWDAVSKELIAVVEKVQANSVLTRMRARVAVAQPPCIPWVEPYMAQLKAIHGKRPDQLEGGLINFKKKRELATLILEFQLFQNRQPYCYEVVPIISEHLRRALESSPVDDNQMMQVAGQYTVEEIQEIHNPGAVAASAGASRAAAQVSTADSTAKTKNLLAKFKSAGTGSAPPAPSEARAGAGAAAAVALVTPTHSSTGMSGTGSPFVNPAPAPAPGASYPTYMQSSPHSSGTFTSQQIASQSHTPPTSGTPTGTLRRDDGYDSHGSHGRSSGQSLAASQLGSPQPPQAEYAPAPVMERRRTASLVASLMNDKDVKAVMRSLFTDEVKAALEKQKAQLTQSMKAEIQAAVNEEVEAWKARVKDHVTLLASRVQIVPDAEVQAAASIIISRCFPSGTVTEWKVEDPNGAIFGWPDEVRYNLVQEGEEQTLVAVLPHVAKSDVSIWLRSYRYYQQCFPTPNLQSAIITPSIAPDAAAAAAANGIRVLQLVL